MNSPESWIAFTEAERGPDYQVVIVPWPDSASDIAWSQDDRDEEGPVPFNRLDLGCSDALGYTALPGISNEVALFSRNDKAEWDQFALVELIAGGVISVFNAES
ncbi:MAG: hypothetical protein ACR2NT_09540 [Acidimicrobiia bacterium]